MGKHYLIGVLEGDGIGPEITREGLKALNAIERKYGHVFETHYGEFGAQAALNIGSGFPKSTKKLVREADGILKGPIGPSSEGRAELKKRGINLENETVLALRGELDTYANFRPVILSQEFSDFSPLKPERLGKGVDIMMVRELTGGNYFGRKVEGEKTDMQYAIDEGKYTAEQVRRIAKVAFEEARRNGSKVTNVSKPNVMAEGRLWDAIVKEVAKDYQDISLDNGIVDAVAYKLVIDPSQFNGVMLLENMQGDIITDQAAGILGSLGLMPSACINPETGKAYYEPAHGSAPDIAGQNIANPYSIIGSVAFMLDKSFGMKEEAKCVWKSLQGVFAKGYMTKELFKELSEKQQQIRADNDFKRLYPAFRQANPTLSNETIKELILDTNKRYDACLEARVISTSEFGDKVMENIIKE